MKYYSKETLYSKTNINNQNNSLCLFVKSVALFYCNDSKSSNI